MASSPEPRLYPLEWMGIGMGMLLVILLSLSNSLINNGDPYDGEP